MPTQNEQVGHRTNRDSIKRKAKQTLRTLFLIYLKVHKQLLELILETNNHGKVFLKNRRELTYLVKTGCCSKKKCNDVIKIFTITLQKQNKKLHFFLVEAHFQKPIYQDSI